MAKKVIKLYRQNGSWWVDFVHDEEVMALFGTMRVVTPFSSLVPEEEVLRIIQERNPECLIMVC